MRCTARCRPSSPVDATGAHPFSAGMLPRGQFAIGSTEILKQPVSDLVSQAPTTLAYPSIMGIQAYLVFCVSISTKGRWISAFQRSIIPLLFLRPYVWLFSIGDCRVPRAGRARAAPRSATTSCCTYVSKGDKELAPSTYVVAFFLPTVRGSQTLRTGRIASPFCIKPMYSDPWFS